MAKTSMNKITDEVRELINEVAQVTASAAFAIAPGATVNYFKAMESLLYNYKKLAALVANTEAYTEIEYHEKSKSLVHFTPHGGASKDREEMVEEMARARAISYERTKARFDEIDDIVRLFDGEKEFVVVRMYYFGEDCAGMPRPDGEARIRWEDIALELSARGILQDEKTARRWRNRIVNDMAVCMFGQAAAVSGGTRRRVIGEHARFAPD